MCRSLGPNSIAKGRKSTELEDPGYTGEFLPVTNGISRIAIPSPETAWCTDTSRWLLWIYLNNHYNTPTYVRVMMWCVIIWLVGFIWNHFSLILDVGNFSAKPSRLAVSESAKPVLKKLHFETIFAGLFVGLGTPNDVIDFAPLTMHCFNHLDCICLF